uniref:Solute carrier family 35 member B3 n=1 Tax=Canis lupus familiaris TaxID=9615 RepID=A0A8C0SQF2_CANLF
GCCSYGVNCNVRSNPGAPTWTPSAESRCKSGKRIKTKTGKGDYVRLVWIKKNREEGTPGFLNPGSTFSTRLLSQISNFKFPRRARGLWHGGLRGGEARAAPAAATREAAEAPSPATGERRSLDENARPDRRSPLPSAEGGPRAARPSTLPPPFGEHRACARADRAPPPPPPRAQAAQGAGRRNRARARRHVGGSGARAPAMRAPCEEAATAVGSAGVGGEEKKEDLPQQAQETLNKGEETNKDNFRSTECSKIRTMDLKFNNSRKYISITVPPKTQTMSPHIKSIDDIVVLGINLSRFNKLTQFFICVAGVFVFYLIYGYLQNTRKNLHDNSFSNCGYYGVIKYFLGLPELSYPSHLQVLQIDSCYARRSFYSREALQYCRRVCCSMYESWPDMVHPG